MIARHPAAPALPADREILEAFAIHEGLAVEHYKGPPDTCPKLKTIHAPYPQPASCAFFVHVDWKSKSNEGYLVLYDSESRAFAVESNYEYTGL